MKLTKHSGWVLILLLCLTVAQAFAETSYTKRTEMPPLRLSYDDLQAAVNKAASLMQSANGARQIDREKVAMEDGGHRVEITSRRFVAREIKLPDRIESFSYDASMNDPPTAPGVAPTNLSSISHVSFDLNKLKRTLAISGASPEQVDALYSALRDELNKFSSDFPGYLALRLIAILGVVAFPLLTFAAAHEWWKNRDPDFLRLSGTGAALFAALLLLNVSDLFTLFSAVPGDASLLTRYGPHFGFWGFMIAAVVPWISMWRKEKAARK